MKTAAKHYKQVFEFMEERVKGLFWVSFLCFIGLGIMVYYWSVNDPDFVMQTVEQLMTSFESKGLFQENQHLSCLKLFFSNAVAAGSAVGWGAVPFLFLSIPMLAVNAIALGLVASFGMIQGMSFSAFLAGILPHGIFEIPALILSAALGINLCIQVTTGLFKKDFITTYGYVFLQTLKAYVLVVVPLLAAAAVIETYITGYIMMLFM